MKNIFLAFGFLMLAMTGCADEVGDPCVTAGATTSECVADTICTNDSIDIFTCRPICTKDEDCSSNEACNGVSGSNIKSCQVK